MARLQPRPPCSSLVNVLGLGLLPRLGGGETSSYQLRSRCMFWLAGSAGSEPTSETLWGSYSQETIDPEFTCGLQHRLSVLFSSLASAKAHQSPYKPHVTPTDQLSLCVPVVHIKCQLPHATCHGPSGALAPPLPPGASLALFPGKCRTTHHLAAGPCLALFPFADPFCLLTGFNISLLRQLSGAGERI